MRRDDGANIMALLGESKTSGRLCHEVLIPITNTAFNELNFNSRIQVQQQG